MLYRGTELHGVWVLSSTLCGVLSSTVCGVLSSMLCVGTEFPTVNTEFHSVWGTELHALWGTEFHTEEVLTLELPGQLSRWDSLRMATSVHL